MYYEVCVVWYANGLLEIQFSVEATVWFFLNTLYFDHVSK